MIKTSKKQKTIEYESRDIVCDLCEAEVKEGQAIITLTPAITTPQGSRYNGADVHKIDICSVDCLVKNAGTAGLLLNTKILPDLRTKVASKPRGNEFDDFDIKKAIKDEAYKKATWSYRSGVYK